MFQALLDAKESILSQSADGQQKVYLIQTVWEEGLGEFSEWGGPWSSQGDGGKGSA